jgi:hypothetical protein
VPYAVLVKHRQLTLVAQQNACERLLVHAVGTLFGLLLGTCQLKPIAPCDVDCVPLVCLGHGHACHSYSLDESHEMCGTTGDTRQVDALIVSCVAATVKCGDWQC